MSADEYFVEIVERGTLRVENRMGPFSVREAIVVSAGASRNLRWQSHFVRTVEPKKARRKNLKQQEQARRKNGSKKRSRNRRWDGQLTGRRKRKLDNGTDLD